MTLNQYMDAANVSFEKLLNTINSNVFMNGLIDSVKGAEIVSDIEEAVYYSTDQDVEDKGLGVKYWTELLEYNTDIFKTIDASNELPNQGRELVQFTSSLGLELVKKIKENLSIKNFPNEIMGVVCENFGTFFIEYTYLDKLHPFNEKLLDIYKLGGFPCGWRGEFPEGKILIYSKNN